MTTIKLERQAQHQSTQSKLFPIIVLVIALLATTFATIFIKLAQQSAVPSPLIVVGRLGIAALILSPLVWFNYREEITQLNRRELLFALFAGLWVALHFMALVFALENTTVLIVMVIINTGPLWTAVLEKIFLKVRLSTIVWLGMFITIIGSTVIAILSSQGTVDANPGENTLLGIGLTFLASMAGAAYITIARDVRAKVSLIPYVWIVFGFGGVIALIIVFFTGTPIVGHSPTGYLWLIMLAMIPQLIGHSGFNFVVRYFSATLMSIVGQSLTVTAAVAAFFVFGEVPGMAELIGAAIIIPGIAIALYGRQKQTP